MESQVCLGAMQVLSTDTAQLGFKSKLETLTKELNASQLTLPVSEAGLIV